MKVIIILYIFFFFVSSFNEVDAQKANVVLLQGKVLLANTNRPVGKTVNFIFVSQSGKKLSCSANSLDGSFQQSLNSGESYKVLIKDYILADIDQIIEIPFDIKYQELNHDIFIKDITPGNELFSFRAFDVNKSTLLESCPINQIKTFIDMNPGTKLNIIISSIDSWFSGTNRTIQTTDRKGKKITKKVKYTSKEQLSDFLDERIESLKTGFKKAGIFLKENSYSKDLQVLPLNKKQKKREIPGKKNKYELYVPDYKNVTIVVTK